MDSHSDLSYKMSATSINRDCVLGASLVLSIVSLVLLLVMTWHFQSSMNLQQKQVEHDKELLSHLQGQQQVVFIHTYIIICISTLVVAYV